MQRATRSAAPSAAANTSHSTPIKTPAKRGRKPKLPSQTSPPETDKQDQPSIDQPTLAPQEETRDSPEPQQSTQEVDSLELVEKVIDLDENEVPVLMSSEEAQMILDVLEKIDADGLLDQSVNVAAAVFSQSSSDQHEVSSTLRSLLDQSNDVSLRHIYKAAQNFTIRVAPKSRRRSAVSERTKRFCDLLHQLLLELIQSKGAVFGERVNLDVLEKEMKQPPTSTPYYALFQQLGQAGTYFSSAAQLSREQLAKLSLGQAETVAVVPTQLLPSSDLPTLGSLVAHRVTKTRPADPLSTVKRLPYDPFASFAPTYATEAAHIEPYESILARQAAANFRTWEKLYWPNFRRIREARVANRSRKSRSGKVDRESSKSQKRAREMDDEESDRVKRRKIGNGSSTPREEIVALFSASATDPPMPIADESAAPAPNELVIDPSLLEADLLQEVESVLGPGVGMCQIDQLLEENTEALQALRTLQDTRLRADARLNDESAECQLAKALESNLSMLVDWQPRSSQSVHIPPLVPGATVLSKLEKSLPLEPVPGYKGILKPNSAALKDNTTVRIVANSATDASTHSYAPTPTTFSNPTPNQPRFVPRASSYPHAAAYTQGQATSYQPVYAPQGYGSPHAPSQPYSHYAGAYGANGHSYSATGYPAYASPGQGYAAYPGYSYAIGGAGYPTAAYTPTQHVAAHSSQSTLQGWSYTAQTPAAALPPHMRTAASRSTAYNPPMTQPYAPWSKA